MARIILLDTNTLGIACGNPKSPRIGGVVREFRTWTRLLQVNGIVFVIPEVADYEVRRSLFLERLRGRKPEGIARLDDLRATMVFLPITREAMVRASEIWAEIRFRGHPTAPSENLDGDAIIAAQGLCYGGYGDTLTIATDNTKDLSKFVDARRWREIES